MILASGLAALAVIGTCLVLAGWIAVVAFTRRMDSEPASTLPITVLKPLHGVEPLLEAALSTLCEQQYQPGFQIVYGFHDADDKAIPVVRALQAKYPDRDMELVIDPTLHGANPKVSSLINMLPSARHDILVIADSDVHARPDYLRHLAQALDRPGVGLVTTLYTGLPAFRAAASRLGATQITHGFLPGALVGRAFGRRDCLGATMCLRRDTLSRIGGFAVLRDHLADDQVLGRRVSAQGLDVALAGTVVATTVPERTLAALWRHELRWARTIRTLEPAAFAASVLQYPLCLASLTVLASGFADWACVLFVLVWVVRAVAVTGIDHALGGTLGGLAFRGPLWLLPLRDLLSAAEWVASHAGRRVDWRGQSLQADTPPRFT
ncbi:MAG: bacteriohopanetetrol glucosamine biosynthesis glycosyltransferase HpnI [Acetobacteraceae bacterium]